MLLVDNVRIQAGVRNKLQKLHRILSTGVEVHGKKESRNIGAIVQSRVETESTPITLAGNKLSRVQSLKYLRTTSTGKMLRYSATSKGTRSKFGKRKL